MIHYIYKITCLITNKFYYGMHSTKNLNDRYFGGGKHLKNSVNKYGKENHLKEIIEYLRDRDSLKKREREIVNEELLKDPLCMNLKIGGEGGSQRGIKRSAETLLKRSITRQNMSPEELAKLGAAISAGLRGKKRGPQSTETKLKRSISMTGKKMQPFTEEHLKNMSIARRKRITSEKTKGKMSESGKKVAEIRRQKGDVTCPHCNKQGGLCAMKRWHFDNCRENDN